MTTKSDRDNVRSQLAAGGWLLAYGDVVDTWTVAGGVMASMVPGVGLAAWVKVQITAQLQKFGRSLSQIPGATVNQVIGLVERAIKNRSTGEWDINGVGVKVGIATYNSWWKIPPFGGWNKLPPKYQPYVGFRIQRVPTLEDETADPAEVTEVSPEVSLDESGPPALVDEPPESANDADVEINFGLPKEEVVAQPISV